MVCCDFTPPIHSGMCTLHKHIVQGGKDSKDLCGLNIQTSGCLVMWFVVMYAFRVNITITLIITG